MRYALPLLTLLALLPAACGDEPARAPSEIEMGDLLLDPFAPTPKAPETFRVRFKTTKGDILIEAKRAWSPAGVDRFYRLVKSGYYKHTPFYRVVPRFVAQFGFQADRQVNLAWRKAFVEAEPNKVSNMRGMISFAQRSRDTRSVHMFINLKNNAGLDRDFAPVARVVEGMDVVDRLYAGYNESPKQPDQTRMTLDGIQHLARENPLLDYITSAEIID